MTIPANARKAGPFIGDGTTRTLPFAFKVFSATDVQVVQADANGNPVGLAAGTDYAVTVNTDQTATPGGVVTLTAAPLAGYRTAVLGAVAYDQPTRIPNSGSFKPAIHENAFDRMVVQMQQLAEVQTRSIVGSPLGGVPFAFPAPNPGRFIRWNPDGSGFENALSSDNPGLQGLLAAAGGAARVGYLPALPNTYLRTPQAKLDDSVSIYDFLPVIVNLDSDCSAYIQKAHDAVEAKANGGRLNFHGIKIRCSQTLRWNPNKVALDGAGATVDFSGILTGDCIKVVNTLADGNVRSLANNFHPMNDFQFLGRGAAASTSVVLFQFNDTTGVDCLCGVKVNNVTARDFSTDVAFGAGAFGITFDHFTSSGFSTPTTYSIQNPSAANSGEQNTFRSSRWFNRPLICDQSNIAADTHFIDCTFAYFGNRAMVVSGGTVQLHGCHIEAVDDTGNWFVVTPGAGGFPYGSLRIFGGIIVLVSAKTAFAPFASNAGVDNGGVYIEGLVVSMGSTWTTPLVDGAGFARVRNVNMVNQVVPTCQAENRFAYSFDYSNSKWAADYTLSSVGAANQPPYQSAGTGPAGQYTMEMVGSPTNTPMAKAVFPISAGDYPALLAQFKVTGLTGSGGTFYFNVQVLDKAGNQMLNNDFVSTTNVSAYTVAKLVQGKRAPPGAATVSVSWGIFGVTSGSAKANVFQPLLTIG